MGPPVGPMGKPDKDAPSDVCSAHVLADWGSRRSPIGRTQYGAAQRFYRALVTLPAFRQRVHTYTRLGALPTRILTF